MRGEPGGARDAISARDISQKTSLMGRAPPGSATEGDIATGGASAGGGEGGGRISCPPSPISPEPLRLSARTGRSPPPAGAPAGSSGGGGGRCSPPRAGCSAPDRAEPVGWACGSPATAGSPPPPGFAGGSGGANHACRTLDEAAAPATTTGCPRDPARSSAPLPAALADIARIAASGGWGTSGTVQA